MPTWTPWGMADQSKKIARGIVFYSTPGHGGFKITEKRFQEMPDAIKKAIPKHRYYLWFEKDDAFCLVMLSFPSFFQESDIDCAKKTLKNWYPDIYEAFFEEIIPEGESLEKDNRLFLERNKDNYVVISASCNDSAPELVRAIATKGGQRDDGVERKIFLVPVSEYRERSRFGFVIDLNRHQEST